MVPRPHQWVVPRHFRLSGGTQFLADTMRLGKSVSSVLCTLYPECIDSVVFIICPAHLIDMWKEQLTEHFNASAFIVQSKLPKLIKGIRFYICSYEKTHHLNDGKRLYTYGKSIFTIVDECHAVKNPKTKRVKDLRKLTKISTYKIFLSGTPIPNRPLELFTQLDLLSPGFMSYRQFTWLFCDAFYVTLNSNDDEKRKGFLVAKGYSRLDKLNELLFDKGTIRRSQNEVWGSLPEKICQTIRIGSRDLPDDTAFAQWARNALEKSTDKGFWICSPMSS